MRPPLRIPAVLAFTVVGAAAAAATQSCGPSKPTIDAAGCVRYCIPEAPGSGDCPPPTCATGSNHDVCPAGCILEPVG